MDYAAVVIHVGIPPREVTLRLAFSSDTGDGHIVLYNRQHAALSGSYETLIDNVAGRDVVDFFGARWKALIVYAVRPESGPDHGYDGLWLLSPDTASLPMYAWERFSVTRHALRTFPAGTAAEAHPSCHIPIDIYGRPASTAHSATVLGLVANVTVTIGGDVVDGRYTLAISPDTHTTYLPTVLFQRYFEDRNMFSDDPATWPHLTFVHGDDCVLDVEPRSLLPLSTLSPGKTLPRERTFEVIMHQQIWADSRGELTLGESVVGYNALKVHPHTEDNHTIVLAGNVLWSCAALHVDQRQGTAFLSPNPQKRELTGLDGIFLLVLGMLYVRWKFAGMWLDVCKDARLYMVIITRLSLVGAAFIFVGKLIAYLVYLPALMQTADAADTTVIVFGAIADALYLLVSFTVIRDEWRPTIMQLARIPRFIRRVFSRHAALDAPRTAEEIPYIPKRLPYNHGRWDPRAHYGARSRNRDFVWVPTGFITMYMLLVDVTFASTIWFVVETTDDRLFADILLVLVFTVLVYQGFYNALLLVSVMVPMWNSEHSRPINRPAPWFALAAVIVMAVLVALFSVAVVIRNTIDRYSSQYQGAALNVVVFFYVTTILFLASVVAKRVIQQSLCPLTPASSTRSPY